MAYLLNPKLPKIRAEAVNMVRNGRSMRQVARYYGFNPSTISRWCKKVPMGGCHILPTEVSRSKNHPKSLDKNIVKRIVELRHNTNDRCAEVIHQMLLNENIKVSLSSVKRTLDRQGLIKKRNPWKRLHRSPERPYVAYPGDLVQVDTIHMMKDKKSRIYIYTLMDLYSRWSYARAANRANTLSSIKFVRTAKRLFPFNFQCLQSDHGSEFSQHFTERIKTIHRHSRVRRPNDNAHLERFNRTIQDEFLDQMPKDVTTINKYLPRYLKYYNEKRLHMGIGFKTPMQILTKCCKGSE